MIFSWDSLSIHFFPYLTLISFNSLVYIVFCYLLIKFIYSLSSFIDIIFNMKFTKALTSAFLLGTAVATSDGKFTIDPESRVIRDEHDRHVIFHGVNVVYKVDPYIPGTETFDAQTSLDDEDIDNLVKWGFNFVRLGVMWEGVETAPGVWNEKYLADVNSLVTRLGEKGIYTLIDSH